MRTFDTHGDRLEETIQHIADIALVIKGVMTNSKVNFSDVKWCPIEDHHCAHERYTQRTRSRIIDSYI